MPEPEVTLGEVYRLVAAQTKQLQGVIIRLDGLSTAYIPRSEHELVIGGLKMDLARVEKTATDAQDAIDELDDKLDSRFRATVTGIAVSLLFPVIAGVVLYLLLGSA